MIEKDFDIYNFISTKFSFKWLEYEFGYFYEKDKKKISISKIVREFTTPIENHKYFVSVEYEDKSNGYSGGASPCKTENEIEEEMRKLINKFNFNNSQQLRLF